MLRQEDLFETEEKTRRYSPSMFYPVFDPKVDGVDHPLYKLADRSRYLEALKAVEEAEGITDEEREFFKLAATRFIEFNFTPIAEKYCVSSKAARDLYEKLCLVYVSTTQAIMNTLVRCDSAFENYCEEADKFFEKKEKESKDGEKK